MAVIDATMLMLFLRPDVPGPAGVDRASERVAFLVDQLEKAKETVIVPTPALSEVLVRAGSGAATLIEKLNKYAVFRVQPFDTRAAIEVAMMARAAIDGGNKRGASVAVWSKVKYDRQIVAIAIVTQSKVIYSDDADIRKLAKAAKIEVIGLADLALPPEDPQMNFDTVLMATVPMSALPKEVVRELPKPPPQIESRKDDEIPP